MPEHIQSIDLLHLVRVTGGAEAPGSGPISSDAIRGALESPSARMTGINPGERVFENNHSGPSPLERVNSAFDNSTRAMRTFNEIGGALTKAPGFGRSTR